MQITNETIRKFQLVSLNILKEIIKLCESHKLRYFAFGGTCLGAVRHQGFIPWDNDIDIAMPRKDYEKFREVALTKLPNNLLVQHYSSHKRCSHIIMRVVDKNTTTIYKMFKLRKEMSDGIGVDIMPFDGILSESKKQKKTIRLIFLLMRMDRYYRASFVSELKPFQKIFLIIAAPFRSLFGWTLFVDNITRILGKYDFDANEYIVCSWSYRIKDRIFKRDWFSDYVYLNFEDIKIRCPIGYDGYLKQDYGNYMQLPPLEARMPRFDDLEVLNFEHSYFKYDNKKGIFDE
jgi:lipopolysaccharide cholinephosphotransferase